jgi:hypothetical protein
MKAVFLSKGRNTAFYCVIVAVMSATTANTFNSSKRPKRSRRSVRSNGLSSILATGVLLLGSTQYALAVARNIQSPAAGQDKPVFEPKTNKAKIPGTALTSDALNMARLLEVDQTLEQLKTTVAAAGPKPDRDQMVDIMFLRQKLSGALQYASLELEEALADIDGDLSFTNMEYSILSAKNDRAVMLNNAAAFLTSGTLGVLDSASGIKHGPPLPNVLGITGNASAIAIPLWGLRPRKYQPIRSETTGNMLAPIFNLPYPGEGYDPIIWSYLESVPAGEKSNMTRRQLLQQTWKKYRNISLENTKDQETIKRLAGVSKNNRTVTLELLKTRAELLVELRSLVRQMYADLSDLNTEIMKY